MIFGSITNFHKKSRNTGKINCSEKGRSLQLEKIKQQQTTTTDDESKMKKKENRITKMKLAILFPIDRVVDKLGLTKKPNRYALDPT